MAGKVSSHSMTSETEKCDVLLISASVGAGHNQAALAVRETLQAMRPDLVLRQMDSLDYVGPLFRRVYAGGYAMSVTRMPWLYGLGYRATDRPHRPGRGPTELPRLWHERRALAARLLPELQRLAPRLIIHTHFLAAPAIGRWIADGRLSARQFVVVTDNEAHRWWFCEGVDRCFLPNEHALQRLARWNIPADRLTVSGIPIRPKWLVPHDRHTVLDQWNLPAGDIVLLSGGTEFTCGPIVRLARGLLAACPRMTLVVLAGRNKALLARLSRLAQRDQRLRTVSFTDRLAELTEACSLMITKPGGVTTAECLSKGVPMVLLKPVPGQEAANARYFQAEGAAITTRSPGETIAVVRQLLADRARLALLSANARRLARPSAQIIAQAAIELLSRKPCDSAS